MNFCKTILFFALLIGVQSPISAQEWVSYQSPQQINDLVDDENQLLMATDAGLVVMDKSTLEKSVFNKGNSNLSNNHIQAITRAADGSNWIGTYDVVLAMFDGSDFQDVTTPVGLDYNPLTTVLYDFEIAPNGDFWLGTSSGVMHKHGEDWSLYDEDELGPSFFEAWDIEINDESDVFVASVELHKYSNGVWSNLSQNTQLSSYLDAEIFFSNSGDLFFAGDLERIGRFDGENWQEYNNGGLNGSEIIGFAEDMDGNIYFNTLQDGIFKLIDDVWTPEVNAQTTAFDNKTSYLYIDEQGNHWLNNGIHISVNKNGNIQSTTISPFTIEYNNISKIHKGKNGYLYFISAYTDIISSVSPEGDWSYLPVPNNLLSWEDFTDLLFIADDDIWLASNNGLYHYNGSDWEFHLLGWCNSFATDNQGKIYVRTTSQIYIIEDNEIAEYNADNSPLSALIISGHGVDASGNLWVSSFSWEGDNVIQKVSPNGVWTNYNGVDFPALNNRPYGDFHFDNEGNIWVAADLIGAIKFDGETFANPLADNLAQIENSAVSSIESDATGKLYFSHQYGVTTLFDGEWEDLVIEEVPVNLSHDSNIKFDDDGTLWWASNRYGVFSYSPEGLTSTLASVEENTGFSIYPNPVRDNLTIDFSTERKSNVKALIYNQIGELKSNMELGQFPSGNFRQSINVSHLSTGFYIVQLQIDGQTFANTLVVE